MFETISQIILGSGLQVFMFGVTTDSFYQLTLKQTYIFNKDVTFEFFFHNR